MAHALANHLPVGLVGEVRTALADRAEIVRSEIAVLDQRLDLADVVPLAVGAQLDDRQFVLEVVEDQQELVEDVADVGGIGIAVVELPDGDVLEIAHRVERRIAEEAAKLASVAVNAEFIQKFFQRVRRRIGFAEGLRDAPAVGVFQKRLAVVHADAGDGAEGDERKAVLTAVIIGTFEQRRLRIDISEFEVETDRRMQVSEEFFGCRGKSVHGIGCFSDFTNCRRSPDGPYSQDRSPYPCRRGPRRSAPPRPRGGTPSGAAHRGHGRFRGRE